MDFGIIENLTEEEIMELYDGTLSKNNTIAGCNCDPPGRYCLYGCIHFGGGALLTGAYYGGCELIQEHSLFHRPNCVNWCHSHGFEVNSFFSFPYGCYCNKYGEHGGGSRYGWADRCTR